MPAPAKRRLHGDTSRKATAAAIQLKPQAKASSTTSSLAVRGGVGASGMSRRSWQAFKSGPGSRKRARTL